MPVWNALLLCSYEARCHDCLQHATCQDVHQTKRIAELTKQLSACTQSKQSGCQALQRCLQQAASFILAICVDVYSMQNLQLLSFNTDARCVLLVCRQMHRQYVVLWILMEATFRSTSGLSGFRSATSALFAMQMHRQRTILTANLILSVQADAQTVCSAVDPHGSCSGRLYQSSSHRVASFVQADAQTVCSVVDPHRGKVQECLRAQRPSLSYNKLCLHSSLSLPSPSSFPLYRQMPRQYAVLWTHMAARCRNVSSLSGPR